MPRGKGCLAHASRAIPLLTEGGSPLSVIVMEPYTTQVLTSAVAPIVMVSASGLLFNGLQTKSLHLSDRIRALMSESRSEQTTAARRQEVTEQIVLFLKRMRLNQWALQLLYVAILCFVATSLLLASTSWTGTPGLLLLTTGVFIGGVCLLIVALLCEFLEMVVSFKTIQIEVRSLLPPP